MAGVNSVSGVKEGDVINDRFLVRRLLGKGSFGVVFLGTDTLSDKNVAIKVDGHADIKGLHPLSLLHIENSVLTSIEIERKRGKLGKSNRCSGFPKVLYFGQLQNSEYVLVMELLGHSLEALFAWCGHQFSMKTILRIMDQLLFRIYCLHEVGYIHRDLKPANMLMGVPGAVNENKVHLIDFGLAKCYWAHGKPGEHAKENLLKDNARIGTVRYMSCRAHNLNDVSRRDDMESLAYVMAFFLKGKLPWQEVGACTKKQRSDKIVEIKSNITPERLYEGCPAEFPTYFKLVQQLKFEDKPEYAVYQAMFRNLGRSHENVSYSLLQPFDWAGEKEKQERKANLITNPT